MFADVTEAVEEIKVGRMVVVVDDEDRENEGDLTLAAEFVTPEGDQLHGEVWPGVDLPDSDGGKGGLSATWPDDAGEYLAVRDGVYRVD